MNINIVENTQNIDSQLLQATVEEANYIEPKSKAFLDIKEKLQGIFDNFISSDEKSIDELIEDKFLDLDFAGEFDVDAQKIGVNDAIFFVNLMNEQNNINYTVQNDSINITNVDGKTINPSSSLMNILQTSVNTNKPIRLDFDNDITVILKMDKDGKIQTHFLPGTAEVEAYLKNNIQSLKQAFDEQEINYSKLSYSKYKEQNNSKKEKRGNN